MAEADGRWRRVARWPMAMLVLALVVLFGNDALASHLDRTARANGLRITRVILATDLQDDLIATEMGRRYAGRLAFSRKPSWVRHDDHYHVDFELSD